MLIHMSTLIVLKNLFEEKLPDKKFFYRSLKDGTNDDKGKKLDGHVSDKEYLKAHSKVSDNF